VEGEEGMQRVYRRILILVAVALVHLALSVQAVLAANSRSYPMMLGGIGSGAVLLDNTGTISAAAPIPGRLRGFSPDEKGFLAARIRIGDETHAFTLSSQSVKQIPCLPSLISTPGFPISEFEVPSTDSPVAIQLRIFSPFIPHDLPNSTLPAVAFIVTFHNPLPIAAEVSALISCPSLFVAPDQAEVLPASNGFFGAHITSAQGETAVYTYPQRGDATVTSLCWNGSEQTVGWWRSFVNTGNLTGAQQLHGVAKPAIALAVHLTLVPHDQVQIPFVLAWYAHTPQSFYYATLLPNATAIAQRLLANWLALYALTAEWQDNLKFSNLPSPLIQRLRDCLQPLLTEATIDHDGFLSIPYRDTRLETGALSPMEDAITKRLSLSLPLLDLYPDLIAKEIESLGTAFRQHKDYADAVPLLLLSDAYVRQTGNLFLLQNERPILRDASQVLDSASQPSHSLWRWGALSAAASLASLLNDQDLAHHLLQSFAQETQTIGNIFRNPKTSPEPSLVNPSYWLVPAALLHAFDANLSLPILSIPFTYPSVVPINYTLFPAYLYVLIMQNHPDAGLHYSLLYHSIETNNPLECILWGLLDGLSGFRIDQVTESVWLLPDIPGDWPRLECPIFSANLWATLHYTPTARGENIRLYIARLFAPGPLAYPPNSELLSKLPPPHLVIRSLFIPAPPPGLHHPPTSLPEVHLSLAQRPLGFQLKPVNPSVLCLQLDAPLQLTAGDTLDIEVH
jgi:hypothetical protein